MAAGSKEELVAQLDQLRERLTAQSQSLRTQLSPGFQLKNSLQRHPGKWMAASAGTAFFAMRLLKRRKAIQKAGGKKRSLLARSGIAAFKLARPALTTLAIKHLRDFAEIKYGFPPTEDNSMLGGPPQK